MKRDNIITAGLLSVFALAACGVQYATGGQKLLDLTDASQTKIINGIGPGFGDYVLHGRKPADANLSRLLPEWLQERFIQRDVGLFSVRSTVIFDWKDDDGGTSRCFNVTEGNNVIGLKSTDTIANGCTRDNEIVTENTGLKPAQIHMQPIR